LYGIATLTLYQALLKEHLAEMRYVLPMRVMQWLCMPMLAAAMLLPYGMYLPLLWGIFFAMGIGMSLPWLLIVAWPGLAQRLPRPGR
ncbi:hypothetical protein FPK55_25770, partial [Acinetobacter baumannii]|nr:hypothetical protein [Acinetobacter baumannii]